MTTYDVTEAACKLSELIDRTLAGESIVISRDGKPVVRLNSIAVIKYEAKPVTQADIEWLAAHRIEYDSPPLLDAGELISRMRDEGER